MPSRKSILAFFVASSMFAGGSAAKANFIYTYTGNSFTSLNATPGVSTGALAGANVTGEFTLSSALGDNFNGVVKPTQFSFSAGPFTINNLIATSYSFDIQTSNTGAIIDWTILTSISGSFFGTTVATSNARDSTSSLGPTADLSASNSFSPGTWSVSDPPSATPIPAALPLFASGVAALGLFGWHRRRKTAALAA
jgi:hypothetical protein